MRTTWSNVQRKRLRELEASKTEQEKDFKDNQARDKTFQKLEGKLVKRSKDKLREFREVHRRPGLCMLETRLIEALIKENFCQVLTPIIMAKGLISKMSIDNNHPLYDQIYWLDNKKCLRPMLAPHLYYVIKDLLRLWERPVRIFEVGPCFRKESQGAQHSSEFTMLNLTEFGLPKDMLLQRIKRLTAVVCEVAGVTNYCFEKKESEVYGETIDVLAGEDKVEVGSAAMGPHQLDRAWKIIDTWMGIGFGLERLLMVARGTTNLGKVGRNLSYLNGIRLNI